MRQLSNEMNTEPIMKMDIYSVVSYEDTKIALFYSNYRSLIKLSHFRLALIYVTFWFLLVDKFSVVKFVKTKGFRSVLAQNKQLHLFTWRLFAHGSKTVQIHYVSKSSTSSENFVVDIHMCQIEYIHDVHSHYVSVSVNINKAVRGRYIYFWLSQKRINS